MYELDIYIPGGKPEGTSALMGWKAFFYGSINHYLFCSSFYSPFQELSGFRGSVAGWALKQTTGWQAFIPGGSSEGSPLSTMFSSFIYTLSFRLLIYVSLSEIWMCNLLCMQMVLIKRTVCVWFSYYSLMKCGMSSLARCYLLLTGRQRRCIFRRTEDTCHLILAATISLPCFRAAQNPVL